MNIDVYCDESRQDLLASSKSVTENNRYCCIGGLMLPVENREIVKQKINALKIRHSVFGEIKWSTVSTNKLQFYLDLVDLFFSTSELSFRTVVIDATHVHNDLFNNGDQELGYYKFYYQLLYHWISCDCQYRIFTDQKTNGDKQRLKELRRILNTSCYPSTPVGSIQAIDSKESLILQLENVIMGSVAYRFNYPSGGSSFAKNKIVEAVENHLCHRIHATYPSEKKLNIFVIRLKGEY